MVSLFQQHVQQWKGCTKCPLHLGRQNVVFVRGKLPCDILFVGEGPGECITGDSLIETAYRDKSKFPDGIPIKDLVGKKGFKVYSYDVDQQKLVLGTVNRVWCTGVRKVYRVSYFWLGGREGGGGGRQRYEGSVKVTANHQFLLKSGFYRSIEEGLRVGHSIQPFYRRDGKYHFVGTHSKSLVKEMRFLMSDKLGRLITTEEQVHHKDRNKWNDSSDNLELLDVVEHARLHGFEDNPMSIEEHRETHRIAVSDDEYRKDISEKMKAHLADPDNYAKRVAKIHSQREATSNTVKEKFRTDPMYYYRYLLGRMKTTSMGQDWVRRKFKEKFPNVEFPPENHQIFSIEECGEEKVYDMEVEQYHNFAVNGIFVHNSEDTLGRPFVGPAGRVLDFIVSRALAAVDEPLRLAFTNIVGCIPRDGDDKASEPEKAEIVACTDKLKSLIKIAKPRLIVAVGNVSQKWLRRKGDPYEVGDIPLFDMLHPAAILKASVATHSHSANRCIVSLRTAVEDMLQGVGNGTTEEVTSGITSTV